MREIDRFFREEHRIILPLTVREILTKRSRESWISAFAPARFSNGD